MSASPRESSSTRSSASAARSNGTQRTRESLERFQDQVAVTVNPAAIPGRNGGTGAVLEDQGRPGNLVPGAQPGALVDPGRVDLTLEVDVLALDLGRFWIRSCRTIFRNPWFLRNASRSDPKGHDLGFTARVCVAVAV